MEFRRGAVSNHLPYQITLLSLICFFILFFLVTPSAHLTIFNSATSIFLTCLSITATVSIPQSIIGLTTLLYILPLALADYFLSHKTSDTFFQLTHPAWILLLTFSSHLPLLLTVEPRYLKFLLFLPFFLAALTLLDHPHPSLQMLSLAPAHFEVSSLQCISPNLQIIF